MGIGDSDERRAVDPRPGDVNRCLKTWDEPLVGVDQRIGQGSDGGDMSDNPSQEMVGNLGEVVAVA